MKLTKSELLILAELLANAQVKVADAAAAVTLLNKLKAMADEADDDTKKPVDSNGKLRGEL